MATELKFLKQGTKLREQAQMQNRELVKKIKKTYHLGSVRQVSSRSGEYESGVESCKPLVRPHHPAQQQSRGLSFIEKRQNKLCAVSPAQLLHGGCKELFTGEVFCPRG